MVEYRPGRRPVEEIVRDPKSYRPAPCPDCGADQRVFGWACVELDGRPAFQPTRVRCTERCEQPAETLTA